MRFPSRTINDRYVCAPVAREWTTEENPRVSFFIHLCRKTYDFVDRELPWEVLTRFGVPTIRNSHEFMRTRVRTDDGERPE